MSDLIKRLCRPGYDLQKEQAIQEAVIEIRELRAENAGLVDDMNLLRDNNASLRARIEEMEKQEPTHWSCKVLQANATWKEEVGREVPPSGYFCIRDIRPLYALPGAKGE